MAPDADGDEAADGDAPSLPAALADGDDDAAGDGLPEAPLTEGPVTGTLVHAAAIERSSAPAPSPRCNGIARKTRGQRKRFPHLPAYDLAHVP